MRLSKNTRIPHTIIDGDSFFDTIIYVTASENLTEEETVMRVHQYILHTAMNSFNSADFIVALSPQKTFRNQIYTGYKSNRPQRSEQKTKLLELYEYQFTNDVVYLENFEADDLVIYFAKKGSNVVAIDKDIKLVCPTRLYDFKKRIWQEPIHPITARGNMIMQSIMGDTSDGFAGVKDYGKGKARKLVENDIDVFEWTQLFESIDEAILTMRLVRMDQLDENLKLKLWDIEDWYKY